MAEWLGRPATQIAAAVRAGDVTARAVVAEHLARIRAINDELHAFRVVREQHALAEADFVDARADRADLLLAGVPLAVKDNTAVAGEAPRCGSAATPALAQPPPDAVRWGDRGWLRNVVAASRYSPFAPPWNLAGWLAVAVPAGVHRTGPPLAVQLVAPSGSERRLLAIAHELELRQPWPPESSPPTTS